LLEAVGPETPHPFEKVGKINFSFSLKHLSKVLRDDVLKDIFDPFDRRLGRFDVDKVTVDAKDNRVTDFNVHVRCATVNCGAQYTLEEFHIS
jgi:hypothetical protein